MKTENNDPKQPVMIEIPFEEYKELLTIKGKYEELKSNQLIQYVPLTSPTPPLTMPTIIYTDDKHTKNNPDVYPPYKITC